jgi:hypothetical protein
LASFRKERAGGEGERRMRGNRRVKKTRKSSEKERKRPRGEPGPQCCPGQLGPY